MVLKKLAKHNRKTLNQPILELYKAGAASYGVKKKKPAKFRRVSRFRFPKGAHLCASGPAPQWPRRTTHARHTSLLPTREARR